MSMNFRLISKTIIIALHPNGYRQHLIIFDTSIYIPTYLPHTHINTHANTP